VTTSDEVTTSVEVTTSDEPNISFNIFMDIFSYYFNTAFPLKLMHVNSSIINKWIAKGIIISRNKLRLLCNIKRCTNLSIKSLKYIQNYQMIYRKVITEANKERRIDSFYQLQIKTKYYGK
jgi:hypothetical protein